ncbi:MAG: ATP-dependent 6-phosphofructokinase [Alphaproteobacteria bacterium]|nr:ATP-dependent 6-phosphofructokinase [Alphaproteobacteria bacterium]
MSAIKRIGILTSGGDCSGLNTVIRAVVFRAILEYKWEVFGIKNATDGLIARPMKYKKFSLSDFDFPFAKMGGTMLGTNNSGNANLQMTDGKLTELTNDEVISRFKEGIKTLGLDALVVIGGDGSMAIVSNFCRKADISMIGIPKTIDNDAPVTEYSVGFATAKDVVMEALDRLDTTATSHNRVMILEVMGRGAGHLALESAIAGFADVCLIPEIPYTYEGIVNKLKEVKESGRTHSLVVVAEGISTPEGGHCYAANGRTFCGVAHSISEMINEKASEFNVRTTILGHVQRGGEPSAEDRIMASAFGVHAVDCLAQGKTDQMVAFKEGKIESFDLSYVLQVANRPVDKDSYLVKTAEGLGIYLGELDA